MKKFPWENWTPEQEKKKTQSKFHWEDWQPPQPELKPSLLEKVSVNIQANPIQIYEPKRDRADYTPSNLLPKIKAPEIKAPQPQRTDKNGQGRITPTMKENIREAYPSSLAGFTSGASLGLVNRSDPEFYKHKQEGSPIAYGIGDVAGSVTSMASLGAVLPVSQINNPVVKQIVDRARVGALVGAGRGIGQGKDAEGTLKEMGKTATYFGAGAAASAGIEKAMIPFLDKLVSSNPYLAKAAQRLLDTTKGATFATAGTIASIPLYEEGEKPSTEEIIKRAVSMGIFSLVMSSIGGKGYQGQTVGGTKEIIKSADQLKKEGYTLFNKEKGVWVLRDSNGGVIDQAYEPITINGIEMRKIDYLKAQQANQTLYGKSIPDEEIARAWDEASKNPTTLQKQPLSLAAPSKILPPKIQAGTYGIKNKKIEIAINEYNTAIKTIQDRFKTNELRADEVQLIKTELGIDLDKLVNNIQKNEQEIDIYAKGELGMLKVKAGVSDTPKVFMRPPTQSPVSLPGIQSDSKLPSIETSLKNNFVKSSPQLPILETDEFLRKNIQTQISNLPQETQKELGEVNLQLFSKDRLKKFQNILKDMEVKGVTEKSIAEVKTLMDLKADLPLSRSRLKLMY